MAFCLSTFIFLPHWHHQDFEWAENVPPINFISQPFLVCDRYRLLERPLQNTLPSGQTQWASSPFLLIPPDSHLKTRRQQKIKQEDCLASSCGGLVWEHYSSSLGFILCLNANPSLFEPTTELWGLVICNHAQIPIQFKRPPHWL